MPTKIKEQKWRVDWLDKHTIKIEGENHNIPEIASSMGTIFKADAQGKDIFILKVKGFSLPNFKRVFYEETGICLDEAFSVQAQFEVGRGTYTVTYSGMSQKFPVGSALP